MHLTFAGSFTDSLYQEFSENFQVVFDMFAVYLISDVILRSSMWSSVHHVIFVYPQDHM